MTLDAELWIITGSYPYDLAKEHTFLAAELPHLAARFSRVVLIPQYLGGERHALPPAIAVDDSFGGASASAWTRRLATARGAIPERRLAGDALATIVRYPRAATVRGLAAAGGRASWVKRWLSRRSRSERPVCVYTYWCDSATVGAVLAKGAGVDVVVSRAHGLDVYEERHDPPLIPFRRTCLEGLDHLFSVSGAGLEYMRARYPDVSSRSSLARLGVRDPARITPKSEDGVLRVVSCSGAIALKRLPLILDACEALARTGSRVEWTHFGDGPDLPLLRRRADDRPPGLQCVLPGFVPNDEVQRRYAEGPFDVFVNASTTEGVPVSIMEALSFGIPVVATAVGGTPEIVNETNGLLVAKDAAAQVLGDAIRACAEGEESRSRRARATFVEVCDADTNYSRFAADLAGVVASHTG